MWLQLGEWMQFHWCVEMDIHPAPRPSPSLWASTLPLSLGPTKPLNNRRSVLRTVSEITAARARLCVCVLCARKSHTFLVHACVQNWHLYVHFYMPAGLFGCVVAGCAISQRTEDTFFEQWAAKRKQRGFQMVWRGRCLTWRAWLLFLSNLRWAGNTLRNEPGGPLGGKLSVGHEWEAGRRDRHRQRERETSHTKTF